MNVDYGRCIRKRCNRPRVGGRVALKHQSWDQQHETGLTGNGNLDRVLWIGCSTEQNRQLDGRRRGVDRVEPYFIGYERVRGRRRVNRRGGSERVAGDHHRATISGAAQFEFAECCHMCSLILAEDPRSEDDVGLVASDCLVPDRCGFYVVATFVDDVGRGAARVRAVRSRVEGGPVRNPVERRCRDGTHPDSHVCRIGEVNRRSRLGDEVFKQPDVIGVCVANHSEELAATSDGSSSGTSTLCDDRTSIHVGELHDGVNAGDSRIRDVKPATESSNRHGVTLEESVGSDGGDYRSVCGSRSGRYVRRNVNDVLRVLTEISEVKSVGIVVGAGENQRVTDRQVVRLERTTADGDCSLNVRITENVQVARDSDATDHSESAGRRAGRRGRDFNVNEIVRNDDHLFGAGCQTSSGEDDFVLRTGIARCKHEVSCTGGSLWGDHEDVPVVRSGDSVHRVVKVGAGDAHVNPAITVDAGVGECDEVGRRTLTDGGLVLDDELSERSLYRRIGIN